MAGNGKRKYNSYIDDLREGRQPNFPARSQRRIRARESAGTLSRYFLGYLFHKTASAGRAAGPAEVPGWPSGAGPAGPLPHKPPSDQYI
jgi:hypothetical protein